MEWTEHTTVSLEVCNVEMRILSTLYVTKLWQHPRQSNSCQSIYLIWVNMSNVQIFIEKKERSSTFFLNLNGLSYIHLGTVKRIKNIDQWLVFYYFPSPWLLLFLQPISKIKFIHSKYIEYLHASHTMLGAWDVSINKRQKTQRQ